MIGSEHEEFVSNLKQVKLDDVLECIKSAKLDSYEKANSDGSNKIYYDGKDFVDPRK